ncbi:MAG: ATPase AAA [Idiomarina sp. T82-3]|jgi:GTPase SAR1 family protein|uniref:AAA family ATPase n=1 Tax=Idiomarina TaxID=135575 RepID=UPI000794C789|nr:ATP-binding protein [Idiomarina sp. T82-3]KXS33960.1 MAG: ATPase AAA [Idiomarina sp. T82-3]
MNAPLSVSPTLPALPIDFSGIEQDSFESACAPLSFYWLARCFNLSGNKESKEKLSMRIRHLTRLYNFPEDLFEQLVSFGDTPNIDWSPRVAEITGVRALQKQLKLTEQEYRILAFAFLSSHSRLIGALRDFLEHTFSDDSQLDIISRLIGVDRTSFLQLTSDESTIVQMHLTGPAPYSLCLSHCARFEMQEDILAGVLNARSVDDNILSGLLKASSTTKHSVADFSHLGAQLQLLRDAVSDATHYSTDALSILLVGAPGAGKTQLAKALASDAGAKLYEVPVIDDNRADSNNNAYRLGEFLRISNMLQNSPTCHILFDEVEDVLNERENEQKRKGWINQTLERRCTTTYWICNDIDKFDESFLRRFDLVVKMPMLDYRSRVGMLQDALKDNEITSSRIHALASLKIQTPAEIERLKRLVARTKQSELSANDVLDIRFPNMPCWHSKELGEFDASLCNVTADINIEYLADKYKANAAIRTLITSPSATSGSGKSALARYLCFECSQSTHFYHSADLTVTDPQILFSAVGNAFKRAATKREMLVIDELDQLLAAAERIMPNPDSFYRWLSGVVREFHSPLVITFSDSKALTVYPLIAEIFDVKLTLNPWSSQVIQSKASEFAARHQLTPTRLPDNCSATPQQLIQWLRQCELHQDMNRLNLAFKRTNNPTMGFLARVS